MSAEISRQVLETGEQLLDNKTGKIYKIVKKIGEGRCAIVYEAVDCSCSKQVALKVYNSGIRYDGAFQRELTVLETLQATSKGNNTINWYGQFQTITNHCVVLELLENNIRQILYKNKKQGLTLWGIQKFARDIFRGLQALHSQELVHADLKPANIHWCPHHGTYKLLDFGLSFHLSEEDIHQVQSMGYQAPEVQIWNMHKKQRSSLETNHSQDKNNVKYRKRLSLNRRKTKNSILDDELLMLMMEPFPPSKAIDIWSVGCLLMEVASGQKFLKDDAVSSHLNDNEMVIHDLVDVHLKEILKNHDNITCMEFLKDLIHRCLDYQPSSRITFKEALVHPFLTFPLESSLIDHLLLPTRLLRLNFGNMIEPKNHLEINETLSDIFGKNHPSTSTCERYVVQDRLVFILHTTFENCRKTLQKLKTKSFKDRTIVASYFPLEGFDRMCKS